MNKKTVKFENSSGTELSAILHQPPEFASVFVMGHGSGSHMRVPLMEGLADALGTLGVATLRFNYPYSEHSDFVPFTDMPVDPEAIMIDTIHAATYLAKDMVGDRPVFVGGHSISGYLTTRSALFGSLRVEGLIALAFPRKGDPGRSEHLVQLDLPTLIIQGTRDALGTREEIEEMMLSLPTNLQLGWVEGASHVFKSDNAVQSDLLNIAAAHILTFIKGL